MMLQTLNILRRIRDDVKLQDASLGMEPNAFGSVQKMLKEIFREWDKFSGDELYPVPSPRHKNSTPYNAYRKCYDMWRGPYGELLNFTIAYLERRLDSYLPLEEINKVLHKIQPGLAARLHGFEYSITGAKTEGILPMQWRTGHIMYGYKNTPTPAGWFYVSGLELETFVKGVQIMKLSAISYLLHIILQTYGYVDIDDGGDEYRVIYDATNPKFLEAPEGGKDGKTSCETLYQAMEKALEITRSVEECEITCDGQWFKCSHFGLAPDEEIIDCYVTAFSESVTEGYEQSLAFMRNGDQGLDWYDLWNEGSFKEAADSLMFCREE